eukprot:CAMPEP_0172591128 /NCGR_PEP_ID=MMETSP1068-20121228/9774_1 /TAXON_ID=35684 /ORGANISM="Pseudopedinella elastica, Strain CCMP716" /LENGTH=75 /DNA_ID=CAMNT_0013387351 /DNA_START=147 /DNA_END=374 /DNA_ORIENTATION=-
MDIAAWAAKNAKEQIKNKVGGTVYAAGEAALNNEVVRNLVQNEVVEAVKRDPKAAVEAAKELMDRVEEAGKAANK